MDLDIMKLTAQALLFVTVLQLPVLSSHRLRHGFVSNSAESVFWNKARILNVKAGENEALGEFLGSYACSIDR